MVLDVEEKVLRTRPLDGQVQQRVIQSLHCRCAAAELRAEVQPASACTGPSITKPTCLTHNTHRTSSYTPEESPVTCCHMPQHLTSAWVLRKCS